MTTSPAPYTRYPLSVNLFVFGAILASTYLSVWLLADRPFLASLPIALVGIFGLFHVRSIKLFVVFLLFFFAGTMQEMFFISHGLWSYQDSNFFFVPFFLPFVWGNIAILTIALYKGILLAHERMIFYHRLPPYPIIATVLCTTLVLSLVSLFLFADQPIALFGILFLIDILYVLALKSLPFALVGLVCMIFGSLGDFISVHLGIWHYFTPEGISNIPPYIFIGWDIVGLLIIGCYLLLDAPDAPWSKYFSASHS